MFITTRIPVMTDKLSPKKHQQLEKLTSRDTTIIKQYLTIIEQEQETLWRQGRKGTRLDKTKLDHITLTSSPLKRKKKDGTLHITEGRPQVKHDLKMIYHERLTVRELKECRDTSVAMWQSYCEQVREHNKIYWQIMQKEKYLNHEAELAQVLQWWELKKKPAKPCYSPIYTLNKFPRRANIGTTVFLHKRDTKLTSYWLEVYYPGKRVHLWLPLNPASYHLSQLDGAKTKTVYLVKHQNKRWYAHITLDFPISVIHNETKPLAVVGVDLGLNKAAVAVLLTADNTGGLRAHHIRFFEQKEKKRRINELDNCINLFQRKTATYQKQGKPTDNLTRKLRTLRHKRKTLAIQYDHALTAVLSHWIQALQARYQVYVALGKLKGIRHSRWKGDGKSRKHRRILHRWAFARITTFLRYKLARIGLPSERFLPVHEDWTSRTCFKCGSRRTTRPFQALVLCEECGVQLQADLNGAMNLAIKLILSLDEVTLDHWLTKPLLDRKSRAKGVSVTGAISTPRYEDEILPTVSRKGGTRKKQVVSSTTTS
ncbi:MAG: RNA-guided endonuclease TnpB family protein [Promethearchaeota archaeon]